MQAKTLLKPLDCYGPATRVAYVRWAPSSSSTQTLTDSAGVSSVTRSAIGEYVVNFSVKPEAIYPLFANVVDNSTTARSSVRVESTSATAGTATVKHVLAGGGNVAVTAVIADVSTASSAFVAAPIAGTITSVRGVLGGAIAGADAVITTEINGVLVTNGGFTVANAGSAAGDRDSGTPTANNTVAVGDAIEAITDGASTNAVTESVTYIITPTVGSDTADEICCAFLLRMGT
jgi:hypothetical protein